MRQLIIEMGLTTDCQLKCQYCYSHHNPQYMQSFSLKEFENAIEPIMQYYNCDTYHISYFGGEPLMNWRIIEESLPQFRTSSKCSSIVVITNGLLLTQKMVDFLKAYKCGISWSFDGLWSKFRTTKLEDAERIMPLALQLTSSCKVMVSPLSRDYVENFKYFLSKGIRNPDFCLVRDDIWSPKAIEYFKTQMRDLSDFIITQNATRVEDCVSTGLHTLYVLDALAGAKFGKRNHGCFVGSNGILYAFDGSIWPCERFRSNQKFQIYDSNTKVYFTENLELLKNISNPQEYTKCQQCELYKYCNAGCTYSQFDFGKLDNHHTSDKSQNLQIVEPIDCVCELQKICYAEGLRVYKSTGTNYQKFIHRLFENAK